MSISQVQKKYHPSSMKQGEQNQNMFYLVFTKRFLTTIKRLLKRKSTSCTNKGVQLCDFGISENGSISWMFHGILDGFSIEGEH